LDPVIKSEDLTKEIKSKKRIRPEEIQQTNILRDEEQISSIVGVPQVTDAIPVLSASRLGIITKTCIDKPTFTFLFFLPF